MTVRRSRDIHPHWWQGSSRILGLTDDTLGNNDSSGGFGVTPALLSTGGARLVLGRLRELHGDAYVDKWIGQWGPDLW